MAENPLQVIHKKFMKHLERGYLLKGEHIIVKEIFGTEHMQFGNDFRIELLAVQPLLLSFGHIAVRGFEQTLTPYLPDLHEQIGIIFADIIFHGRVILLHRKVDHLIHFKQLFNGIVLVAFNFAQPGAARLMLKHQYLLHQVLLVGEILIDGLLRNVQMGGNIIHRDTLYPVALVKAFYLDKNGQCFRIHGAKIRKRSMETIFLRKVFSIIKMPIFAVLISEPSIR